MAPATLYSIIFFTLFSAASSQGEPAVAIADDECLATESSDCALNALQKRGSKVVAAAEEGAEVFEGHNNAALAALGVHFNATGMDYDLMAMGAPGTPLGYDGRAWTNMVVSGAGPHHAFAIGDWGGMDGAFEPGGGHHRIIAYPGGHTPGPHVFPRNRFNKAHSVVLCDHKPLVGCYASHGAQCPAACGYVEGVDDKAQLLVARAFNARAGRNRPKFVMNVGDNFYWGGLEVDCGTPMGASSLAQTHQFNSIFNGIYGGAAPWISALGNHDWGGFAFTNGWDQQIAYTWKSGRWIMPASYFSQHISFPDAGFSVDVFVLDSNHEDAKSPDADPEHNICSRQHNKPGAHCPGGPASVDSCPGWFAARWAAQAQWLPRQLAGSKADWQIVVTHFPCGSNGGFFRQMHASFGLDLLVTGHRHDQELWSPGRLGGLTCFVTGGGGGISSEASPDPAWIREWYGEAQYGFYDLTISKATILIESINYDGKVLRKAVVYPKGGPSSPAPPQVPVGPPPPPAALVEAATPARRQAAAATSRGSHASAIPNARLITTAVRTTRRHATDEPSVMRLEFKCWKRAGY
eukprot:CAMPEP_0175635788 /NCGR_PEP_ID=MMETSP0097-20121207/1868_1 /TAXON_ID=311494 /ORGANISM="Alexandrium monilatum, Strain CCMP3105" /LENGTH=577 /DNA_ID=CAMNT_0016941429 /DNA_START=8 /DNA_END=1742 /DNA_ORIENTATION=+